MKCFGCKAKYTSQRTDLTPQRYGCSEILHKFDVFVPILSCFVLFSAAYFLYARVSFSYLVVLGGIKFRGPMNHGPWIWSMTQVQKRGRWIAGRCFVFTLHACHQIQIIACGLCSPIIETHIFYVCKGTLITSKHILPGHGYHLKSNTRRSYRTWTQYTKDVRDAAMKTRFSFSVEPRLLGYIQ